MNYTGFHLTQLSYNDFIKGIEQQYGIKWAPVQLKIYPFGGRGYTKKKQPWKFLTPKKNSTEKF